MLIVLIVLNAHSSTSPLGAGIPVLWDFPWQKLTRMCKAVVFVDLTSTFEALFHVNSQKTELFPDIEDVGTKAHF